MPSCPVGTTKRTVFVVFVLGLPTHAEAFPPKKLPSRASSSSLLGENLFLGLGRQVLSTSPSNFVGCGGDQGMYSFVNSILNYLQKYWGLVALPH